MSAVATDDVLSMPVTVGGLTFRNPLLVGSGPTAATVEQLVRAYECGWGGASIKLTFLPPPYISLPPRYCYENDRGALYFTAEKRLDLDQGVALVKAARQQIPDSFVLFANMSYTGEKGVPGWADMAKAFEDAGVHAIELNVGCPNMSFNVERSKGAIDKNAPRSGASVGQDPDLTARIVEVTRKAVGIPVFVKVSPEGNMAPIVAAAAFNAGADGFGSNANRLAIGSIDVYNPGQTVIHLQEQPTLACFSGPWVKPLGLRDVYEIRHAVGPDKAIVGFGGMATWRDVVEYSLAGADLFGICTATLVHGFDIAKDILRGVKQYLADTGRKELREGRDLLTKGIATSKDLKVFKGHMRIRDPNLAAPCKAACPNQVPAQAYIRLVAQRQFEEAFRQITSRNPLQSVCGYICPHPCENECTRGEMDEPLMIREIKRFVLEYAAERGWVAEIPQNGKRQEKVAVIGSGPAGIACAFDLARAGYPVTVFEAAPKPGGMLRYGIPRFRLPEAVFDREIDLLKGLGVEIRTRQALGRDFTVEGLKKQGFAAVFLGVGAQGGARLGVPGDNAKGVVAAVDFLRDFQGGTKPKVGKRVAVVGGGFTAVDAARTAVRLGAKEVFILYRRTRDEMPAVPEEVWEAEQEGVMVMYLVSPRQVFAEKGRVTGLRMVNHVLGEYDESERRKPVPVEEAEFTLAVDQVVVATGQTVALEGLPELAPNRKGAIPCERKTGKTAVAGVYVGGDAALGASSVIEAIASGKNAAVTIDRDLAGDQAFLEYPPDLNVVDKDKVLLRVEELKREYRPEIEPKDAELRKVGFETYTRTLTEEEAVAEAARCLGCGCGVGCGVCYRICSAFGVNRVGYEAFQIDSEKCLACGMCFRRCPNDNIEVVRDSDVPVGSTSAGH
jgi:NADPH-dependent glutamate synthase beta subunit-like oxidoreductase/dihydroorotate dehydrogenase/ferredoxin